MVIFLIFLIQNLNVKVMLLIVFIYFFIFKNTTRKSKCRGNQKFVIKHSFCMNSEAQSYDE